MSGGFLLQGWPQDRSARALDHQGQHADFDVGFDPAGEPVVHGCHFDLSTLEGSESSARMTIRPFVSHCGIFQADGVVIGFNHPFCRHTWLPGRTGPSVNANQASFGLHVDSVCIAGTPTTRWPIVPRHRRSGDFPVSCSKRVTTSPRCFRWRSASLGLKQRMYRLRRTPVTDDDFLGLQVIFEDRITGLF